MLITSLNLYPVFSIGTFFREWIKNSETGEYYRTDENSQTDKKCLSMLYINTPFYIEDAEAYWTEVPAFMSSEMYMFQKIPVIKEDSEENDSNSINADAEKDLSKSEKTDKPKTNQNNISVQIKVNFPM